MLIDADLAIIQAWGIENGKIPHPTAAIIDRSGKLTYFRVDEDYKVRPPTVEELLPALAAAD